MGASNSDRKNILVVEDDTAIASMLMMMLELEGYGVSWASSAQEAIRLLTDGASAQPSESVLPDLVLLDLQLPDMHGAEMIRIVNASGKRIPPVIVVSAGRHETVEQGAFEMQATDMLVKPFEVQTLIERIKKALNSSV